MTPAPVTPWWSWAAPALALSLAALGLVVLHGAVPAVFFLVAIPALFAAVFAAVHHAETVAHRIGQPFGSIVLALSVTVIEVSLIVSMLLSSPDAESSVARDTVFAAIMIVLNGIVGLCLLIGGLRFHEPGFQARGAIKALGVLGTLAVLGLVLPNYTTTTPGPVYAPKQLIFVATVSLALYGLFLYVQTIRHKEAFRDAEDDHDDHTPPDRRSFLIALLLLPLSLLAVVLLAEVLAHPVEEGIAHLGLPEALIGVIIALIVLLPEALASVRAARANRLQTSMNLALGSALASLCLTIPTVAILSLMLGQTLILGLEAEHIVLLVLSLFMATLTLATGRTTILQGGIHLVIFFAFLTIAAIP
ncbi:calcium:proton antiporter [Paragemmobacter ruber]|uniref:Ionic transporter y4hA n=1 Tax=Paragemmobacter ruber TaxID=1985673 RepID=A0ABW9Y6I8_9RHOB|nr:ionic transporter y4hA [Rhodobacter ruber]NBE07706.1 ionic transporter y4hA [Rhodobacter ruber]